MNSREELLKSPEYWFEHSQNELYAQVITYMEREGINQAQLAKEFGVTKGYVSQILHGEFNYTLKKLIEISLAVGQVARIEYTPLNQVIKEDAKTSYFEFSTKSPAFMRMTTPEKNQEKEAAIYKAA